MDTQSILIQMSGNAQAMGALVQGYPEHQARWKPDAGSWSILEVINHLADEEREDFRARIDLVLHQPEKPWLRIDPAGWVTERGYNRRSLDTSLEQFLVAREESLAWLRGLGEVDWTVKYQAPFGWMRAGDFLASWAAHDMLHMRQLVELKWAYMVQAMEPYEVKYAGEW